MRRAAISCLSIVVLSWLGVASDRAHAFEDGYGSISGQFVLEGEIPEPAILVKKGDAQAKDAPVCAAEDVKSETLVVDPASKGIANIFVFMRKAPKVHPSLKESKEKTVEFDQKGCHFIPHALLVRTDQVVLVKSGDPISHNTHTFPLRNSANNLTIPGNERKGVEFIHKAPEKLSHSGKVRHSPLDDRPLADSRSSLRRRYRQGRQVHHRQASRRHA